MYKILIVCILIIFSVATASAEIYSWTDEKGVRHYSTTPPEDAANFRKSDEFQYDPQKDEAQTQEYDEWLNQKKQEEEAEAQEKQKRAELEKKEAEKAAAEAEKARFEAEKAAVEAEKARMDVIKKSLYRSH